MQSRRREGHRIRPTTETRLRDSRIEMRISPYLMPSREVMERSPRPRRSLSPPGRVVRGGKLRAENLRSQSPPFGGINERRGNYDEVIHGTNELRKKYEFCDVVDHKDEFGPGLDHSSFRGKVDRDRVLGDARDQLLSGKSKVSERESMYLREYRLEAERDYNSRHAENAGKSSLSRRNLETARPNNESIGYPDPFLLEKLVALEAYRKGEEHTTQSRDFSYSKGSASLSKDTELKEFAGTFSRSSKENMMSSYQEDMSLPIEVHPGNSGQPVGQYSFAEVHQRHNFGTGRDSEAKHNDLLHYKRDAFSPSVVEGQERDYLYFKHGCGEKDDYSYPSEALRGRRRSRYDVDYYQSDIITSNVIEPNKKHIIHAADYSQGRLRSSESWDNPSSQDQSFSKYLYPNKSLATVDEQFRLHMDPESANIEFDDRVFGEAEVSLPNVLPNDGLSRRRISHGSERDPFFVSGKEMRISSDNRYQMEMREHDLRRKAIYSDELDIYDPPRRSLKRKYNTDEDLSRHRIRDTSSDNMYNLNSSRYRNERDDEWNHQDAMDLLPSKSLEYNGNKYRRAGRKIDLVERGGDLISDDRWFYHDPMDYKQEYSSKPFKPGKRILKGQPRFGLLDSYDSQTFNKRRSLPQSKEPNESAYKLQEPKNWVSSSESDPSEESKEFKELVQAFFLSFSKMLNKNLGTQKRYKEQGRAGSLFCIVCGKSLSKEFKDTQGLATHCFMSKKVGLRAQHLGLHKAICVLLGWNTDVGADVITFAPQAVSSSEALAQKEDLILWPPVVIIHSISAPASRPGGQNAFTKEAVEDFLRGKGFSVGKIKVCPAGMSANNIMVVKFLGTFPGLQDAEKLHKYFLDDKHGRIDFEQGSLSNGKDNNTRKERRQADRLEENVLYGYMAVSEDLDKVDFDTKRKCSVKSKKEIEEIAEEPLKF